MATAAGPTFSDAMQKAMAEGAAAGKSGADLAAPVRKAVNQKIRAEFRTRIVNRQQMQFNLYATNEAKAIKAANKDTGQGDKAVGLLAKIAAKIKSSNTTTTLANQTNTFFPT